MLAMMLFKLFLGLASALGLAVLEAGFCDNGSDPGVCDGIQRTPDLGVRCLFKPEKTATALTTIRGGIRRSACVGFKSKTTHHVCVE